MIATPIMIFYFAKEYQQQQKKDILHVWTAIRTEEEVKKCICLNSPILHVKFVRSCLYVYNMYGVFPDSKSMKIENIVA